MPCLFRENRSKILPSYLNRMCARKQTESYGRLCIFLIAIRIRRISDKRTSYILLQRGFTATSARSWAAHYGVGCLSVRAGKAVSLCVSRVPPLGMFLSCLCKRRDHSGRYRLWAAFVPTKSLQHLCFIGRAWPNFLSFYSTFRNNANNEVPQV